MAFYAMGLSGVDRWRRISGKSVSAPRNRPQVLRIHAPSMDACGSAYTVFIRVVADVINVHTGRHGTVGKLVGHAVGAPGAPTDSEAAVAVASCRARPEPTTVITFSGDESQQALNHLLDS